MVDTTVGGLLSSTVQIEIIKCGECGTPFGIESVRLNQLRVTGETLWCPNGHRRCYGKSALDKAQEATAAAKAETERLREERDRWQRRHEHARLSARSLKGVITKTKKRVANGACPCCKRSFDDLRRHMKSKHPGYAGDGATSAQVRQ